MSSSTDIYVMGKYLVVHKSIGDTMMAKLDPKAAGLAVGIPWSLGVLAVGLASTKGYGKKFVETVGSLYPGYDSTPGGACIGSVWAFFDGLGGGIICALLYNAFHRE